MAALELANDILELLSYVEEAFQQISQSQNALIFTFFADK